MQGVDVTSLSLADLVLPYLLGGQNLGAQHAALSALRVETYEPFADTFGATIRGTAAFNGIVRFDPDDGLSVVLSETAPALDKKKRAPVFDLAETSIDFELYVPRSGGVVIGNGLPPATATTTGLLAVLAALDAAPMDPDPSDFPGTAFTLTLVLSAPTVRPPFLIPAKLNSTGTLSPDPDYTEVTLTLPKLHFTITQTNGAAPQFRMHLDSWGVASLDDPAELNGTAGDLVTMNPPYAFVDKFGGDTFGIGFRTATLDLSNTFTPPELIAKAGIGDDWSGLYLPEARIFVSPNGAKDFAFTASAQELMIGFGTTSGVWGDFEIGLINQGSGHLSVTARFADDKGKSYPVSWLKPSEAYVWLPETTRMMVDVSGGRAPYTVKMTPGTEPEQTGTVFLIKSEKTSQSLLIDVTDSSPVPITQQFTVWVTRRADANPLPGPNPTKPAPLAPTRTTHTGDLVVDMTRTTDTSVVVRCNPPLAVLWQVNGGTETATPTMEHTVPLAAGATATVRARVAATTRAGETLGFYYLFDQTGESRGEPAASERQFGDGNPDAIETHQARLAEVPDGTTVQVVGQASFEGDTPQLRRRNFLLAAGRAAAATTRIDALTGRRFTIDPLPKLPASGSANETEINAWAVSSGWQSHAEPDRNRWWTAQVHVPAVAVTERTGTATFQRPTTPPVPEPKPKDPEPAKPTLPDWFRSAHLKVRLVDSELIALEIRGEVDIQTMAERNLADAGAVNGLTATTGKTLQHGTPVGPNNPSDGITVVRLLAQRDPALQRVLTTISVGADPADKDGLFAFGWIPGEPRPAAKDEWLSVLGSYLSFWPLLVEADPAGAIDRIDGSGASYLDAGLETAAVLIPAAVGLLPFVRVERVVLYGAEYVQRVDRDEIEGMVLFDVGVDWSANLMDLIMIDPESPLSVRYKAIGIRLGNRDDDGNDVFTLRPVFDSARGYTIDVAKGGSLKIAPPFDNILRVLGARISKSNPLTLEADIGLGVDLGVISIERASLRAYLDDSGRAPELTALAATIDIPGALVGSGYVEIGSTSGPNGVISTIGGQIDLTLRPIELRISAAVAVATIPDGTGGTATGVYIGMGVVLPVGIPLGTSGLGIFGFRGIFGMNYQRNPAIGAGTGVESLEWLRAAKGHPEQLATPDGATQLWIPALGKWSFGLGMLIGTMEGGVILNLDGTLLLELPGPRLLIMLKARIVSPPPSLDEAGMTSGVLAVIEITPEHFLIAIILEFEIEDLVRIEIPFEAVFPFGAESKNWHIHLGSRSDVGSRRPVQVKVLDIVTGTGYLMFRGGGLPAFPVQGATLPEIKGFAIGLGVGASFLWGDESSGLYIKVGGGMDAVLGFDPFTLAGTIWVSGELRLFIVSIGARAQLTVLVRDDGSGSLSVHIKGEACGKVSFFFFSIEGCVDIELGSAGSSPMPAPVERVFLQSRSPAYVMGSATDRGVDTSLCDAVPSATMPQLTDPRLIRVPIDAIPVIAFTVPPKPVGGLQVGGLGTVVHEAVPGVQLDGWAERSGDKYQYVLEEVRIERINPVDGSVLEAVIGSDRPVVWWRTAALLEPQPAAQLALLSTIPTPASKAVQLTDQLVETITDQWGTVCAPITEPTEQLWTFHWEQLGGSDTGWRLDGIDWPDAPGTIRTQRPEPELAVNERWRSGNPILDGRRGIFPALVIGAQIPCGGHDRPLNLFGAAVDRLGLSGGDRLGLSGVDRVGLADEVHVPFDKARRALDSVESFHSFDSTVASLGGPLARLAFPGIDKLNLGGGLTGSRVGRLCVAKVLQAPIADDGTVVVIGNHADEAAISDEMKAAGVTHGPLDNVVVLRTESCEFVTLLLFVPLRFLESKRLVVRSVDDRDQDLDRVVVTADHLLSVNPLPARWTDPTGPWASPVERVLKWQQQAKQGAVVVTVKASGATSVEIGVLPDPAGPVEGALKIDLVPSYHVGAVSMLRTVETQRYDWDTQQQDASRDLLTTLLGPGGTNAALMHPDSLYRITTKVSGTRAGTAGGTLASKTEQFWFATDRIDTDNSDPAYPNRPVFNTFPSTTPTPVRLDPWMIMVLPEDGETGTFWREPIRLVFATTDIDRLLAAYGKTMRIRFQAASGKHPSIGGAPGNTTDIKPGTLTSLASSILSPWEDALVQALESLGSATACVPVDVTRPRVSIEDLDVDLEPYTDYIMDIELVTAGAANTTAPGAHVLRHRFSTGGFATFDQLADGLCLATTTARSVPVGTATTLLAQFASRAPEGGEFDTALRAVGMEPLPVTVGPRVQVWWEPETGPGALPQPTAVLISADEPLIRTRNYPAKQLDTTGRHDVERWVRAPREWLTVHEPTPAVVAANGRIVVPGGHSILFILQPGSRGSSVAFELTSVEFTDLGFLETPPAPRPIVELQLDRAPWEEV